MLRVLFAAFSGAAFVIIITACSGGSAIVPQQKDGTQSVAQGEAAAPSVSKTAAAASGPAYRLVPLPAGLLSVRINDEGIIAGQNGNNRAVEYRNGHVTELPLLPTDQTSFAFDINDRNQIVGLSVNSNTTGPAQCSGYPCPEFHAVLWQNGRVYNLGTLPRGSGYGQFYDMAERINNAGEIVGQSGFGFGALNEAAVTIFSPGPVRPVLVGGSQVYGSIDGLNDEGELVGNIAPNDSDFSTIPFEYPKTIVCSPAIASDDSIDGINNSDEVPWSYNGATPQAGFCSHGVNHALKDFGISESGLNNRGDIVGGAVAPEKLIYSQGRFLTLGSGAGSVQGHEIGKFFISSNGAIQGQVVSVGTGDALLYSGGKYYDLNSLAPNHPGVQLVDPISINNPGEIIVGESSAPFGEYLLIPRYCFAQ